MFNQLRALFNPELYHGRGKKKRFFEGWYFKIVNADESKAFAIIPGIAMDSIGNKQAFIQVLDGKKGTAEYIKFPSTEFLSDDRQFNVQISNNHFTKTEISLNLPTINGNLSFKELTPWPSTWYSPGIMGPYSFAPFMECYHGILSMDHTIEGILNIQGEPIDFTGGRGYMEKDWGHSFPDAYFWMQSNHFSSPNISLKCSVANIPWMGHSFVGFIAGVAMNNRIVEFTTYNGSKLIKSHADKSKVFIVLENKKHRLEITANRDRSTSLASPIGGLMDGKIEESMTSKIHVKLFDKKMNAVMLDDIGRSAGLEVAGQIDKIFTV